MALSDYKLKFIIDADGRTAEQELDSVYAKVNKLGGGFTSAFGGAIPVAGAVVGGIAAIGTAAAAVGVTLFNITKTAAEYGSTIYDASTKTGLGAETISALDLAAKQSGASLEQITSGIGKFAKTVGSAADGSAEAARSLKQLGIEPQAALNDLDGTLAKVFKRIGDAKPGVDRITMAQKAFGKAGADLIPMMEQVGFNLDEFREKAKALGVTIDDEAAAKADEFGDQMDLLKAQLAGVGRTIGTELMPVFTDMAAKLSHFLSENKDAIRSWGTDTGDVIRGVGAAWREATHWLNQYILGGQAVTQSRSGITGGDLLNGLLMGNPIISGLAYLRNSGAAERAAGTPVTEIGDPSSYVRWKPRTRSSDDTDPAGVGGPKKQPFVLGPQGKAFVNVANKLGISALDLATIVGFESAGTYSTSITNKQGYFGLIQFGASEAKQFGAKKGQGFEEQLEAAGRYLTSRFASVGRSTAGATLLDLYRTVLGGNPNASLTKTDANGTSPLSGVRSMLQTHRPVALARFFGGSEANAKSGAWGKEYAAAEKEQTDESIRLKQQEVAAFEAGEKRKLEIGQSVAESLIALTEHEYQKSIETADGPGAVRAAQQIHDLKIQMLDDEIRALDEKAARAVAGSKEEEEAVFQANIKRIEYDAKVAAADAELEARKKASREAEEKWVQHIFDLAEQNLKKQKELLKEAQDAWEAMWQAAANNPAIEELNKHLDELAVANAPIQQLGKDIGDLTSGAIQQFTQGVGSMVEAWVLYGELGPDALRKMTAQVLASLAAEAAAKALYYTAEGIASLFFAPEMAAGFFAAAAIMAAIAGGAALAGRAIAGDSFKKDKQGGSSGHSSGSSNKQETPDPYSRVSSTAFYSGRDLAIDRLAKAVDGLQERITSMKPGEVLTRAAQERKGFISQTVAKEIGANAGTGRSIARRMGIS